MVWITVLLVSEMTVTVPEAALETGIAPFPES